MIAIRKYFLLIFLILFAANFQLSADNNDLPHKYLEESTNNHGAKINHYGLIGSNGVRLTDAIFDEISDFAPNGLALIRQNGKYGFINTKGEPFLLVKAKKARPFDEFGLAAIEQDSKWGLVNDKMEFILKNMFQKIEKFQSNGLAIVKFENKFGLVDTLGNIVLPVIYDKIENFDKSGYAVIKSGNKVGIVNKRGRAVVPPEFKDKKSALAALATERPKFGNLMAMNNSEESHGGKSSSDNSNAEKARKEKEAQLQAEKARKEKEEQQLLAEKARKEKEEQLLAEKARKEKVEQQLQAEKARKEKEEQKLLAEKARKEDEQRAKAEKARQEEEKKLLAEKAKKEKEEQKLLAEKIRKEKEGQKLLAERLRKEEEKKLLAEKARNDEEKRKAEIRKKFEETPTLNNYIYSQLGEWNDYFAAKKPAIPSEEEMRTFIEAEIEKWQVKGEFEPTARWKERVNESTRSEKIKFMADSIQSSISQQIDNIRAQYKKEYESLANKYCERIAKQFESQTLELKPYDADNETFLVSTTDFGDFLLPVPLDEAPDFKKGWDKWKTSASASFIPNGDDVALKSVKIGKYTYDSDMNATYAQVDVEYNFQPVDLNQLNKQIEINNDLAINTPETKTNNKPGGFKTEKISISATDLADTDFDIPKGAPNATTTFAVVIANGEYDHASKVNHAENDGRIMTQYLTRTLGIPENNVATFINATYGQMASAISMLEDIGDAYKGSDFNLIFYYVGHGLPDDEGKKSYILPVDIDPRHVSICMPLEKIYADLGSIGAKNVTVMVDACFSGANHGDGMLIPQSMGVALRPKKASPVGNMVVLTAADGNETAYPYEEKKHGLFTYWLLKKLKETSGKVSMGELSDFVIDNVKKTSVTINRKPQTPTVAISPQLSGSWRDIRFGQ